jgi:hypothetical protein
VEPASGDPYDIWSETTSYQMMDTMKGYDVYINAQFGARENHDYYIRSGKSPLDWLKEKVETALSIRLMDLYKSNLVFNEEPRAIKMPWTDPTKKYALICPGARTSQALTEETVDKLYNQLIEQGWDVKILVEKRPDLPNVKLREKYTYGYTFVECISIIKKCQLFIGNDSGLAWASLYSDCDKKIYHTKERIAKVNTWFSKIDPKAEDILV